MARINYHGLNRDTQTDKCGCVWVCDVNGCPAAEYILCKAHTAALADRSASFAEVIETIRLRPVDHSKPAYSATLGFYVTIPED